MFMRIKTFLHSASFIRSVFLLSLGYWIYLAFTSHMNISQDAEGYQRLGRMISEQGWAEYFKTGPNREPLYPFLVSISIRLGEILNTSYQNVQKVFQILILLMTQGLALKILREFRVSNAAAGLTLLYLGISPAVVNAGFSLFSEVATYPWLLGIILVSLKAWQHVQTDPIKASLKDGLILGLLFVLMTFVKGIYQFIILLYTLPYLCLLIRAIMRREWKTIKNITALLLGMLLCHQALIFPYKYGNKIYNGQFTLTDRGSFALIGSVFRRQEPLTPKRILTAIASIPGEGFCNSLFGEKDCFFWGFLSLDHYAITNLGKIKQSVPPDQVDKAAMDTAKKEIFKNPVQFFLLMVQDMLKMFFWESTKIGFVSYPSALQKIFDFGPFRSGIRLGIGMFCLWSYFYLAGIIWRQRHKLFMINSADNVFIYGSFFLLFLISCHIGMYSIFDTIPRFALPIAPLFVLTLGTSFDNLTTKKF